MAGWISRGNADDEDGESVDEKIHCKSLYILCSRHNPFIGVSPKRKLRRVAKRKGTALDGEESDRPGHDEAMAAFVATSA